jgi:hypothetical protein
MRRRIRSTLVVTTICLLWASTATRHANAQQPSDVMTVAASESANGVTQADFTLDMLREFERRSAEGVRRKLTEHWERERETGPVPSFTSESHYIQPGAVKIAVVRLKGQYVNQLLFYGIVANELRRVACFKTKNLDKAIPMFSGPCGARLREAYGIQTP